MNKAKQEENALLDDTQLQTRLAAQLERKKQKCSEEINQVLSKYDMTLVVLRLESNVSAPKWTIIVEPAPRGHDGRGIPLSS